MVLLGLAIALATATILESLYDTATAQYWVYRAGWFYALLVLLGVNILCVALSRIPWKPRHTPFLLAHLGILILLYGSWLTYRFGIDGMMRVTEGEHASVVEVDSPLLMLSSSGDKPETFTIPIPWRPPSVEFKPMPLPFGLKVDRYLSRSEPRYSFKPVEKSERAPSGKGLPAIRLKLTTNRGMGGMPAMAISQDLWLWMGAPEWRTTQAGMAQVFFGQTPPPGTRGPWLALLPQDNGDLKFDSLSMRGESKSGHIPAKSLTGAVIDPGWKVLSIRVEEWIDHAYNQTDYVDAKIQYGPQAPPSAIHLVQEGGSSEGVWLGLGDQAMLHQTTATGPQQVRIGYYPKRLNLPFALKLERFTIRHDEGTFNPASFESRVSLAGTGLPSEPTVISMNEPLDAGGYTFYQSSYENANPRPITSIFSVSRDPGRWFKYTGSLLIVVGSILLFAMKYVKKKRAVA